MLLTVFTK